MISLKEKFEELVDEYVQLFSEKHGLTFEFWVNGVVGETASFGCIFYYSFLDIKYDIDTEQKPGLIIQWLEETIDNSDNYINFTSYSKGYTYEVQKQSMAGLLEHSYDEDEEIKD